MTDESLATAAEASGVVRRLRELARWTGAGRGLTQTGRVKLADARALERLGAVRLNGPTKMRVAELTALGQRGLGRLRGEAVLGEPIYQIEVTLREVSEVFGVVADADDVRDQ